MAHSHTRPGRPAFTIPSSPNRLSQMHSLAASALEELFIFYGDRKASAEELAGSSKIGILELVHVWVLHGNAVDFLDTYEKYLTSVGELVAVYGGKLTDILTLEEAKPRSFAAELLFGFQPLPPVPTLLHPAVQRETYEHARRRRQASYELN